MTTRSSSRLRIRKGETPEAFSERKRLYDDFHGQLAAYHKKREQEYKENLRNQPVTNYYLGVALNRSSSRLYDIVICLMFDHGHHLHAEHQDAVNRWLVFDRTEPCPGDIMQIIRSLQGVARGSISVRPYNP